MNNAGRKLRQMRLTQRLSLTDIHRMTGISRSQLSLIENGKTDPRLSTVTKLLRCYGRSFADLEPSPPEQMKLSTVRDDAYRASKRLEELDLGPSDPDLRLSRKRQRGEDVTLEESALATRR
jgi:transcriptional regulator with XRE-family HTH domain